jgi:hypothetical protein
MTEADRAHAGAPSILLYCIAFCAPSNLPYWILFCAASTLVDCAPQNLMRAAFRVGPAPVALPFEALRFGVLKPAGQHVDDLVHRPYANVPRVLVLHASSGVPLENANGCTSTSAHAGSPASPGCQTVQALDRQ